MNEFNTNTTTDNTFDFDVNGYVLDSLANGTPINADTMLAAYQSQLESQVAYQCAQAYVDVCSRLLASLLG